MFCKLRKAVFQKQENRSHILREINRFRNLNTNRILANKNHQLNL